jgi:hypothetical protein
MEVESVARSSAALFNLMKPVFEILAEPKGQTYISTCSVLLPLVVSHSLWYGENNFNLSLQLIRSRVPYNRF